MKDTTPRWFLAAFFVLAFAIFGFGQVETGTLGGTVTDPSGAVIPNAKVTATNAGTGLTRTVTTSSQGNYAIVDLPPGNYNVTVDANGFNAYKQTVAVTVGGRATVDAKMVVGGGASTVVEVTAEAGGAQVNTQDQQISNSVTSAQIEQLPSLTRNPYDFVAIGSNVSSDPNGSTSRGVGVSINGQRAAS